jgi:hypothetical protein
MRARQIADLAAKDPCAMGRARMRAAFPITARTSSSLRILWRT